MPYDPADFPFRLPEGLRTEDLIRYFNEVVLAAEYTDGEGDPGLVQKWNYPLRYAFSGPAFPADLMILRELFAELNRIPGFPGIVPCAAGDRPNFELRFYAREEDFSKEMGSAIRDENADGAAQYWYLTKTNGIYKARIGYRCDMPAAVRRSVLLEEVVNALGFSDTVLRKDSILYQYGSEASDLSETDWLLIRLLYHPAIQAGMGAAACAAVIRQLLSGASPD